MQAHLTVADNPGASLIVPTDAERVVGRGDDCDLIVAADVCLSRRHFRISCTPLSCVVTDLQSTAGTWLNERQIQSSVITSGDVIRAGETTFRVDVWSAPPGASADRTVRPPARPTAETPPPYQYDVAGDVLAPAGLGPEAAALCRADGKPELAPPALLAAGREDDAVRFLAFALSRPHAVWWTCRCLRSLDASHLSDLDREALAAAETFVRDPTEAHRRAAMAFAEQLQFGTAAGWCAVAAFWSEGSLAPPTAPHIPATPELTPKAVTAAVTLAAACVPAPEMPALKRRFVDLGLQIGAGRQGWDDADKHEPS